MSNDKHPQEHGFKIGKVLIQPLFGDITTLEADAFVEPSGTSPIHSPLPLQVAPWVVAANIDGSISKELARHAPLQLGDLIITSPGALLGKYLFHAVVIDWGYQHASGSLIIEEVVTSLARKCVATAVAMGLRSIAFTPWGTRIGATDAARITALLVQAITNEVQIGGGSLQTIYLISNRLDHYEWFVDRASLFQLIFDQLHHLHKEVGSLSIPADTRTRLLNLLANVERNVVVYNQIVQGANYDINIGHGSGIAIGDEASTVTNARV